ncbi:MAG: hypothetical protein ABJC64_14840 [Paracoccaceae bacterium]
MFAVSIQWVQPKAGNENQQKYGDKGAKRGVKTENTYTYKDGYYSLAVLVPGQNNSSCSNPKEQWQDHAKERANKDIKSSFHAQN